MAIRERKRETDRFSVGGGRLRVGVLTMRDRRADRSARQEARATRSHEDAAAEGCAGAEANFKVLDADANIVEFEDRTKVDRALIWIRGSDAAASRRIGRFNAVSQFRFAQRKSIFPDGQAGLGRLRSVRTVGIKLTDVAGDAEFREFKRSSFDPYEFLRSRCVARIIFDPDAGRRRFEDIR